ncbi:MAG: bifunctional enoyl-CoA hydratase/phosphate acetyltransferase [Eubacteriaceae bacterium]|jgi:phosphate butyryltransferase
MLNFEEMKDYLLKNTQFTKPVVAVAAADDRVVLEAIKEMNEHGFGRAILVGDEEEIQRISREINLDLDENMILNADTKERAAQLAVQCVRDGEADIIMKGLLHTKTYLKAILNRDYGLRTGKTLNAVTGFNIPALGRMILATDCGMIVQPTLQDKIVEINSATELARALQCRMPLVSCLSAVETVNENMPDGIDAAILSKMNQRGQITGCIIDGPFSLDLSISMESVRHKGVQSPVAGKADILVMPSLQAGNIFWKSMTFLAGAHSGAVIMGAAKPAVLTSRADSKEAKVNAIAMAMTLERAQREELLARNLKSKAVSK